MSNQPATDLQETLRPLMSLIHKSEKAQQKLSPVTWQHAMLEKNIKALHIAAALLNKTDEPTLTQADLQQAAGALADMMRKTKQSGLKFAPGTSQHTLARNRLAALRLAHASTKLALDSHKP